MVDRGTFKDLALGVCGDEEELVVRREGDRGDGVSEVEMRQYDALDHVDYQRKAINIDADQSSTIRRQDQSGHIASVLEGHCASHIRCQVKDIDFVTDGT